MNYQLRNEVSKANFNISKRIYNWPPFMKVVYSLAVWRFKPILSAGLRFHSHLSGGLRLRSCHAVAGNRKFSSQFCEEKYDY